MIAELGSTAPYLTVILAIKIPTAPYLKGKGDQLESASRNEKL